MILAQTNSVRPIEGPAGRFPPRLQSWLLWKKIFSGGYRELSWIERELKMQGFDFFNQPTLYNYELAMQNIYGASYCQFCSGMGTREDDEFGYYYCICHLLRMTENMKAEYSAHYRVPPQHSLTELKYTGPYPDQQKLKGAVHTVGAWIDNPTKHLILSGPTGVGKTHMLSAIANAFGLWAGYLTGGDFQSMLFAALDNGNVQKVMDYWKNQPILIFDDLGMEYQTKWILSSLQTLIDWRTSDGHWWDTLTVIGTNIPPSRFVDHFAIDGVSRIGSRLADNRTTTWVSLNIADYRRYG